MAILARPEFWAFIVFLLVVGGLLWFIRSTVSAAVRAYARERNRNP